ncbi:Putative phenylalanine aminotransferase [Streptomyces microflavus]
MDAPPASLAPQFGGERTVPRHLDPAVLDRLREGDAAAPELQAQFGVEGDAGVGPGRRAEPVRLAVGPGHRRSPSRTDVELALVQPDFEDALVGEPGQCAQQRQREPVGAYGVGGAAFGECGGSPLGEGGQAVHYICDEESDWNPDLADMASKITDRTRAVVIINPNNPTGAVYPREILEGILDLARRHGLMVFADEIYDQILYDGAEHHSAAVLAPDLVCLTFSGLSKTYRVAGFRSGWLVVSGPQQHARN